MECIYLLINKNNKSFNDIKIEEDELTKKDTSSIPPIIIRLETIVYEMV